MSDQAHAAGTRAPRERKKLGLVDSLVQLSFLIQAVLGRIAAEYELSMSQVRLLGILRDRRPGMLELAAHLSLDKSSITGLVDRAEQRGLVERAKTPEDRRGVRVSLTRKGHALAAAFGKQVEREIVRLAEGLAADGRKALSDLASQIVAGAGAETSLRR